MLLMYCVSSVKQDLLSEVVCNGSLVVARLLKQIYHHHNSHQKPFKGLLSELWLFHIRHMMFPIAFEADIYFCYPIVRLGTK